MPFFFNVYAYSLVFFYSACVSAASASGNMLFRQRRRMSLSYAYAISGLEQEERFRNGEALATTTAQGQPSLPISQQRLWQMLSSSPPSAGTVVYCQ